MPEYVYALHDFQPENEDEVAFHPGERIEVLEKDDEFGDGWWKGRNLAGKIGLFPQSYTAPAPPSNGTSSHPSADSDAATTDTSSRTVLQPLNEESETETPPEFVNIVAPVPQAPPNSAFLSAVNDAKDGDDEGEPEPGHHRIISNGSGEMMKATITDVQKAIEQLGRGRGPNEDGDGGRSFSFASSRDEPETDTDYDMSDIDGVDTDGGQGWHKGARRKLAAKARKAVEEAEKLEAMMGGSGMSDAERRAAAPPIHMELSDESEDEDGEYTSHSNVFSRGHPHIPEEEETGPAKLEPSSERGKSNHASTGAQSAHDLSVYPRESSESHTATATRSSFPAIPSPPFPFAEVSAVQSPEPATAEKSTAERVISPRPVSSPPVQLEPAAPITFPEPKHNSASLAPRESITGLPSPTGSFQWVPANPSGVLSKHSSLASSKAPASASLAQPHTASSMQNTLVEERKEKSPPNEWSIEEVVDWLKSKGFDQEVQDKFIEQEITGDVLIELDVNLLKSEIGIMAFGKRMRIANAITDLRRPPSIIYSDPPDLSQTSPLTNPHSPLSQSHPYTHSRTQSQQSHSYPGTVQSSLGHTSVGAGANGYIVESPQQDYPASERSATIVDQQYLQQQQAVGAPGVGLGIGFVLPAGASAPNIVGGRTPKSRPAQLMLSPSDGALKSSAKAVSDIPEEGDEERAVMSESEAAPTSMRLRLFGRQGSSGSRGESTPASRHSKDGASTPGSPVKEKEKDHEKDKDSSSLRSRQRSKKSIDGGPSHGKGGERLSIFGASFSGTLGRSRKPPPRYSTSGSEETHSSERNSVFSMGRLHSGGGRRSSSQRPVTPNPPSKSIISPKEVKEKEKPKSPPAASIKEKEMRDPTVLRKRTTSMPPMPSPQRMSYTNGNDTGVPLTEGKSILQQIGEPDHNGWMRKKGERYNSWKLRYFVLKGDHMYWLKSSQGTETKVKGFINIVGYKVTYDENLDPGRYGFRIEHDHDKTHFFSSDEKSTIRDWMKAIMKATITRDYTKPVMSSCNIPTIPLTVAQAMNPAPRPPSPTARDATQKALRRENPNQLSSRDARVLMGLPSTNDSKDERARVDTFFKTESVSADDDQSTLSGNTKAPPRPSREFRKISGNRLSNVVDENLIKWANTHLSPVLQIKDTTSSLCGGLALLRIAESIKGYPCSPPIPDSAFPTDPNDDKIEGLFKFFDFLIDNEVKIGTVSINDVRQGNREKILQIIKALKGWEDKRKAIAQSIGGTGSVQPAGFMAFT